MKTTEFINESAEKYEYSDEVGMVKNNLHTMVRASVDLAKHLKDNEDVPEWCQEKIAVAKGMIVAVMDYITSQHEMGHQPEVPGFDPVVAEQQFNESVLGGAKVGGPTTPQEFKDKEQYILQQLASPTQTANYEHFRQALGDLRRVAKERGITLSEDATCGSSMTSSIAVTSETLGEKGSFSKREVNKKLGSYTNMLSRGGPIKLKGSK
jgi:hypothetical protein